MAGVVRKSRAELDALEAGHLLVDLLESRRRRTSYGATAVDDTYQDSDEELHPNVPLTSTGRRVINAINSGFTSCFGRRKLGTLARARSFFTDVGQGTMSFLSLYTAGSRPSRARPQVETLARNAVNATLVIRDEINRSGISTRAVAALVATTLNTNDPFIKKPDLLRRTGRYLSMLDLPSSERTVNWQSFWKRNRSQKKRQSSVVCARGGAKSRVRHATFASVLAVRGVWRKMQPNSFVVIPASLVWFTVMI